MRLLISTLVCCGAAASLGLPAELEPPRRLPTAEPALPRPGAPLRASPSADALFGWPLAPPPAVVRPFEAPAHAFGPGHRGVDLAGEVGQPVLAAGDGVVVYAGWMVDRNLVSIEHTGGLRTTYEPVAPGVSVGDQVTRGQPIGHLEPGHPECAAEPPLACLHWGARQRLNYLDPLRLLGFGHVRLKPWR
ncbi:MULTISPECIES: M23 family metallopeptidase [Saccharopolyspora]|uniref:M23 family metallopeptidase n=1 Tax=Saccharopolyspora elongata TaxID=2530387 RepID=A0A4R4Z202_9PSEU|nr:M23 family metallopeptidase [Saccharopolyspora elongata]TDD52011.1 M23 family metallopeptidase [Saccharopolyspora elongata]